MPELERLDPDKIHTTAVLLRQRIAERFPHAGLVRVADQLVELSSRARATCEELARPNWKLRIAVASVVLLLLAASIAAAVVGLTAADTGHPITWAELVQVAEAGANDLVLLGAAIYFFVSFETRYKRSKVVKALHQLRTLAHLVDAHQLTKTPEMIGHDELRTPSSPVRKYTAFELGRYLDYCSEMLALIGKIAALYGDGFGDPESLEAVNEIEELTVGLQSKIWQKLSRLQAIGPGTLDVAAPREATRGGPAGDIGANGRELEARRAPAREEGTSAGGALPAPAEATRSAAWTDAGGIADAIEEAARARAPAPAEGIADALERAAEERAPAEEAERDGADGQTENGE
ncbi:MAG TPA: hypothetical protein VIL20_10735 [Sandaracinaceae bacterium]